MSPKSPSPGLFCTLVRPCRCLFFPPGHDCFWVPGCGLPLCHPRAAGFGSCGLQVQVSGLLWRGCTASSPSREPSGADRSYLSHLLKRGKLGTSPLPVRLGLSAGLTPPSDFPSPWLHFPMACLSAPFCRLGSRPFHFWIPWKILSVVL